MMDVISAAGDRESQKQWRIKYGPKEGMWIAVWIEEMVGVVQDRLIKNFIVRLVIKTGYLRG